MSAPELLPCPFCGGALTHSNLRLARCKTAECYMHNFVVDMDDLGSVRRWNTRNPATDIGALVEDAYIDGFDDGIHESDRRRIRPHDAQTPQEAWTTSQSANALAAMKGGAA